MNKGTTVSDQGPTTNLEGEEGDDINIRVHDGTRLFVIRVVNWGDKPIITHAIEQELPQGLHTRMRLDGWIVSGDWDDASDEPQETVEQS
jgi:hypothetical protein